MIGPGNAVAYNTGTGVEIDSPGNQVTANSIYDNVDGGIAPGGGVAVPPRRCSPRPRRRSGTVTAINGTVTGTPGSQVAVELFDSANCDAGGSGEGQTYLGSATVTIGADGICAAQPSRIGAAGRSAT